MTYDRLLLCLGGAARRLACPGADRAGVHYLRGVADAAALRRDLVAGARAVIIGGGYIGLETAATCRGLGLETTALGVEGIGSVRQGKVFDIEVDGDNVEAAKAALTAASEKLLANTVVENFRIEIL